MLVVLLGGFANAQNEIPSVVTNGDQYTINGVDYTVVSGDAITTDLDAIEDNTFDWLSLTWPTYGGDTPNLLRLIAEINSPNDGGGAGVPISTRVERGNLSDQWTVSLNVTEGAAYAITPIRRHLITYDDLFAANPLPLVLHEIELARVRAMANDPSNYDYVTQYVYTATGRLETLSVSGVNIFTNIVTDGRTSGQTPPNVGEVRRNVWWRLGNWYSAQFTDFGATIGGSNELSPIVGTQYPRLPANSFRSQDQAFMNAFYATTDYEVVWSYQNHSTLNDAVLFTGEAIAGSYSFGDTELDKPRVITATERIIHIKRDNTSSPWRIESYGPAVGSTSTIRQVINSIGY